MNEQLKRFISENDAVITVIGLVIGVLGIILAIVFYVKSLRNKNANFFIRSFNLLNDEVSGLNQLEVYFGKTKITRLTATKIAIWNSGDVTIEKTDIVVLDPIIISITEEQNEIYDIEVVGESDTSNNFSIFEKGKNEFELKFDYIDKSQGCVIKILHAGLNSSNIKISGKLKGIGEITEKEAGGISLLEYRRKEKNRIDSLSSFILIKSIKVAWLMYLVIACVTIYFGISDNWWYLLLSALCFFASYMIYPKKVLPRSLREIFSSEK